jgi:hypothetical protein
MSKRKRQARSEYPGLGTEPQRLKGRRLAARPGHRHTSSEHELLELPTWAGVQKGRYVVRPNDGTGKRGFTEDERGAFQVETAGGGQVVVGTAESLGQPGLEPGVYADDLRDGHEPGPIRALFDLSWWAPRPADVPDMRAELVEEWRTGGRLTRVYNTALRDSGASGPPEWEELTLGDAALWYVSAPMCDLLDGAAPSMPETMLERELIPDMRGFVVFERILKGLDAEGTEWEVSTGAMLWGPALWQHPQAGQVPCLGITVYRPVTGLMGLVPLGSLVWPLGTDTDVKLTGDPAKDASMAEDRRRLAALWLLSGQRELTTTQEAQLPRQVLRRASRTGQEPPRVRVVHLRAPVPERGAAEGPTGATGRHLHHRFIVAGHWRNQAWGQGRSQRRPTWIAAYPKGPEGAPLLKRSTVKAWDR